MLFLFSEPDQTANEEDGYLLEDEDVPSATISSDTELISGGGGNLPSFLIEPRDAYAFKNKPATLRCQVAHALDVHFRCNKHKAEKSQSQYHVDPQTGTRIFDCELNVTRNDIEEYFGQDKYKCECVALSNSGEFKSQPAIVDVACKDFTINLIR